MVLHCRVLYEKLFFFIMGRFFAREKGGIHMQLIGQAVKHPSFGQGVVTGFAENKVTVEFSQGEKKFVYPDAFSQFLTLRDQTMQGAIDDLYQRANEEQTRAREEQLREQERRSRLLRLKLIENSHAAFALAPEQAESIGAGESLFTGFFLSGDSKGKPRLPSRMQANSACLLTSLPAGAPEKERRIAAIGMAAEDFVGEAAADGQVALHEDYFLRIAPANRPLFWAYADEGKTVKSWGSVRFKYLSDSVVLRLLRDLKGELSGGVGAESLARLYEYFCVLSQLPAEQV